jgi:hypothetical protein
MAVAVAVVIATPGLHLQQIVRVDQVELAVAVTEMLKVMEMQELILVEVVEVVVVTVHPMQINQTQEVAGPVSMGLSQLVTPQT